MNEKSDQIAAFLDQAHRCAGQMLANGMYIQKELPTLKMSDGLRARLNELCVGLIDTKHDVVSEIMELREEFVDSTCSDEFLQRRMELVCGWSASCARQFYNCIEEAGREVDEGEADALLSMLLMESAVNILNTLPAMPNGDEGAEAKETPTASQPSMAPDEAIRAHLEKM